MGESLGRLACFLFVSWLGLMHTSASSAEGVGLNSFGIRENWLAIDNPENFEIWSQDLDEDGGIWIGHARGVAKYDGLRWMNFPLPDALSGSEVKAIEVNREGEVYALAGGLLRLTEGVWELLAEVGTDAFRQAELYESESGEIWAGYDTGFLRVRQNGTIERIELGVSVVAFCEDEEGYLWWVTGTNREVYRAAAGEGAFPEVESWQLMLSGYEETIKFSNLYRSSDGRIWLGNLKHSDGLKYYDLQRRVWVDRSLIEELGSNQVFDMVEDDEGWLWVAAEGAMAAVRGEQVRVYKFPDVPIPHARCHLSYSDDGYIWIGELGVRLHRVSLRGSPWMAFDGLHYQCETLGRTWFLNEESRVVYAWESSNETVLAENQEGVINEPVALHASREGELWAIGSHDGVAAVSVFDGESWNRELFEWFATGFDHDSFSELESGEVLLGSGQYWDWAPKLEGGVLKVRYEAGKFEAERLASDDVPYRIHGIEQTPDGDIWLGGTHLIRGEGGTFHLDLRLTEGSTTESWINSIEVDRNGRLWGTQYGRGVFVLEDGEYRWHRPSDLGFAGSSIIDLAALEGGDLLALSESSVFRYDGERWTSALRIPFEYPLPRRAATVKISKNGDLWLNVAHQYWYSRYLQGNGYDSSFEPSFGSVRYRFDDEAPNTEIVRTPSRSEGIRSFAVDLKGQDRWSRTPSSELQFSYRLDGGEWSPFSKTRELDLQQLNEGDHLLEARARDQDFNVDPLGAQLAFVIDIPFWLEDWFVPVVVVTVLVLVVFIVSVIRVRANHLVEVEHQKLNFFTSLSHEIRTPLALVMAPLDRALTQEVPGRVREYLEQASKSSLELKGVIDQLLEFRRVQSGVMRYRPAAMDLVLFGSDLVTSFALKAAEKDQRIRFDCSLKTYPCFADEEKMKRIFNNLLLNALRYSPEDSEVGLYLEVKQIGDKEWARFIVEDSGIGMSKDFLKVAFKPFSRSADQRVRNVKGTGIGLAYVQELVELCSGRIEIESPSPNGSSENPGTRVIVSFPAERQEREPSGKARSQASLEPTGEASSPAERPILLLVEDDAELREFVSKELSEAFEVLKAKDGREGLALAATEVPDIVLADRMMPEMDGIELCQEIRANLATSHIPVIMLTAASSSNRELEGLQAGVNDYIGKPFSIDVLIARIRTQLDGRDRIRNKVRAELLEGLDAEPKNSEVEDPFLKKTMKLIEENYRDYQFDVEDLGAQLGMSRSSLYRKLKAVAEVSPSSIIRNYRIRKAATLVKGTKEPIGEIMESVGIIEKRSFNKWFKELYDCTPGEYRKKEG